MNAHERTYVLLLPRAHSIWIMEMGLCPSPRPSLGGVGQARTLRFVGGLGSGGSLLDRAPEAYPEPRRGATAGRERHCVSRCAPPGTRVRAGMPDRGGNPRTATHLAGRAGPARAPDAHQNGARLRGTDGHSGDERTPRATWELAQVEGRIAGNPSKLVVRVRSSSPAPWAKAQVRDMVSGLGLCRARSGFGGVRDWERGARGLGVWGAAGSGGSPGCFRGRVRGGCGWGVV